jgi:peptide/nickel transport system substrate-binding protein
MKVHQSVMGAALVALVAFGLSNPVSAGAAQGGTGGAIDKQATIRLLGPVPPVRFDPVKSINAGDDEYMQLIYDRLVQNDAKNVLQPMLATSWSFANNGSYLDMKLRPNVKFQDGTPFNAAAVKANIERSQSFPDSTAAARLSSVSSVVATDDMTVRFNLKPGLGADLPANLATNAGMMVSPAALSKPDLSSNPGNAGSGPYTLASLKPNESADFTRTPVKYWDPTAGLAKEIQLTFLPVGADRIKAVQAGDADIAYANGAGTPAAYAVATKGSKYQVQPGHAGSIFTVLFRSERPAVSNLQLRQAMAAALNRKEIAAANGTGACTTVATQPYAKGSPFYEPKIEKLFSDSGNPAAAKSLLQKSGVTSPKVEMRYASGSSAEINATTSQQMWTDAGIQITPVTGPQGAGDKVYFADGTDVLVQAMSGNADPSSLLSLYFDTAGSYKIVPADQLAAFKAQADKALDPKLTLDQRAQIYRSLFLEAAQNMWYIPICHADEAFFAPKNVVGITNMPWSISGVPDFRNIGIKKSS